MTHKRHRLNVVGPFYVEDGCCTSCGVPDVTAPELFGEADDSCFVKRQPQTASEVDRMSRTMITSEVGCIRYAGVDPAVIRRLAESGEAALADVPPPRGIVPVKRDHVGLRGGAQLTPQSLAAAFVAHLQTQPAPERFKTQVVQTDADRCALAVAWLSGCVCRGRLSPSEMAPRTSASSVFPEDRDVGRTRHRTSAEGRPTWPRNRR
jgi:hypothetical protein